MRAFTVALVVASASTGANAEEIVASLPSDGPLHRWDRSQCGSDVSNEESCVAQGCLWGELEHGSHPQDPWCYHKFTNKCAVNGDARVDCGAPLHGDEGHRKWMCEQAGCCWQPTSHGTGRPWCFKAKVLTTTTTTTTSTTTTTTFNTTPTPCDMTTHYRPAGPSTCSLKECKCSHGTADPSVRNLLGKV